MTVTPSDPEDDPVGEVRRLHPLTPFFDLVLWLRQFLLPLLLVLFANRGDRGQLISVVPLVFGTVAGILRWARFTYTFDGRRLVIDEGVFTRKQRVVPLDRVQQVEMISKLRHRIFGVTVLRVDTAGGGGDAEVDLSVVSVAEAARLRAILLPEGAAPSSPPPDVATVVPEGATGAAPPLVAVGIGRLALAGMTGSELAVMLTILFWDGQLVDDLPDSFLRDLASGITAPASVGGFLTAAAALLVVWFGLAAAASVLKNFGFVMRRAGEDLRVTRGLFDRREASMPIHRLQAARVRASFVRRALGLVEIVLQSAGSATGASSGVARIDVPILAADRVSALLDELLPASPPSPETYVPAPGAARRRAIVRRVLPATAAAVAVVLLTRSGWGVLAGVSLVALAVVAGELAYRGLAHAWDREILVARAGGLARETVIVPAAKAQSTRLRSSPFQRRAGLATLFVDVAGKGRTPQVRDGDVVRLRALQRGLLSTSAAARDESVVRARPASGATATSRHA